MPRFFKQLLLLATACGALASGAAHSAEPVRVRLDWTPWGVHAPFHLAARKGWFKQAGLDVNLEDGNGSVTTIQIVGNGDSFDVGHAALASLMVARDKGLPVKALAVFARQGDIGVLVPADSGIDGPAGLKGKRVAYTAGSLEAPFIDAFLARGGLRRDALTLINVDAAGKAGTYAIGRADAAFSTIPFFLPVVSQTRASRAVRFAEHGLHMPGFGLFASESRLARRGEVLGRFAGVVAAAWEYIYAGHEEEAVAAILAARPQARLDAKVLRGQIDALRGYFGPLDGVRIGPPVAEDWSQAVQTLSSVGLVSAQRPAADYYVDGGVALRQPYKDGK